MKLLIATPSPYARKVRVALIEKNLPFDAEVTVPWNTGTTAPDHNPLGKIPVLILDDGSTVYDSRVIVEYLDTIPSTKPLIPSDPRERIAAKQIEALADGVCDAIVLIAIEARRSPTLQSADWVRRQHAKVEAGIAELDRLLGTRTWFIGNAFSLADIAAASTLGYARLRYAEYDWPALYPRLTQYWQRLEARPSFAATQPSAQFVEEIR